MQRISLKSANSFQMRASHNFLFSPVDISVADGYVGRMLMHKARKVCILGYQDFISSVMLLPIYG